MERQQARGVVGGHGMGWGVEKEKGQQVRIVVLNLGCTILMAKPIPD